MWLQSWYVEIHQTSSIHVLNKRDLAWEESGPLCLFTETLGQIWMPEELLSQVAWGLLDPDLH